MADRVLLPMKPEGVTHQHFNLEPQQPPCGHRLTVVVP
jgi:hypothetical protein